MLRKILFVVATYVTTTLLMLVQKPLFLLWYAQRAEGVTPSEIWGVLWHGLLLDSTTAGYISVIPWLVMLLSVWVVIPQRAMRAILKGYYIVIALIVATLVAVDMQLFGYWDFRLDSTIIPYLRTPKEAAASVTWGDLWPALLLLVGYAALMIYALLSTTKIYRPQRQSIPLRLASTFALLITGGLLFLAIRGGTGTAPANVSKVYFSDNMFLNQAATNPIFSFLSSASRSELKEGDYNYFASDECDQIIDKFYPQTSAESNSAELLTSARPNVVLIILESFGRTVTDEVIDGREVTPHLGSLKGEGVWFEKIVASSYRTDRGTVAIMSGYPTHPIVSIMKYPQKAQSLPAIARSLKEQGYTTTFTYGGDANFTNTISYLYGTGIERITDQRSLQFDAPLAQWGYDDRLVCDYFADEVLELGRSDKPFFSTLLTLSSHEPFDVPHSAFEHKILNAASFTDECVGKMIAKWKQSPIWDNLLVVLIADHSLAYPEELQTGDLARQRIPMLWIGGAVKEPMVVEDFASQSDMAATLLSQMKIDVSPFTLSRNIFARNTADTPKFGFWSYNNGFGIITADGYVRHNLTNDTTTECEATAGNTANESNIAHESGTANESNTANDGGTANEDGTANEGGTAISLDAMRQEYVQQGKAIVQWLHKDLIKR